MTFAYTGGARAGGNSASASVTHGQTINSGDLVVAYVNSNSNSVDPTADAGGSLFTRAIVDAPSGQTARQAFWWKIAGGSEPSSYSFTVGNAFWQVFVKVFTSATDAEVDAPANADIIGAAGVDLNCNAIEGEVISDDAVSIICGGKDNRQGGGGEAYTTADNSFVSVLGRTEDQAAGIAHRIYTTGETFSGTLHIDTADANDGMSDVTYSIHMSFVESAADELMGQVMM